MKRPFKEMKDLDMEQVIADIVEKLKWQTAARPMPNLLYLSSALGNIIK